MPNDRSDAALRERLELAEKATQGPWKSDEVVTRKKDFEPSYVVKDGDGFTIVDVLPVAAYQANAAHIAASSPDVVREDIEELLRLRGEVKRLRDENEALKNSAFEFGVGFSTKVNEMRAREEWLSRELARLDKEADWFIEYIWNKDIFRCPMPEGYKCEHKFKHVCCLDSEETEIRGRCWREAARKAVEEEERHG